MHYKAAAKNNNNFVAEILHAVCAKKAGEQFDCVKFLNELLRNYKDAEITLQILLHLGFQHYHKGAIIDSCRCFAKAIEIDRKSQYLKV